MATDVRASAVVRTNGDLRSSPWAGSGDPRHGAGARFGKTRCLRRRTGPQGGGDLTVSGEGGVGRPAPSARSAGRAGSGDPRRAAVSGEGGVGSTPAGAHRPPIEDRSPRSRQALALENSGLFAYVMRCACPPGHDGKRGGTVVDHVRLFPIRPGVRWTYRVHEQILPSLNRAKIPVRWTDIVIRHDGYADPEVEARKLERNIKILERELIERPDDPFVLFNLGSSAVQQKEYHAALGLLERSLALSAPRDSIVRKLVCVDRPRAPDDRRFARGAANVRGGIEARPSGRRVMAPQGGHSSPSWRIVGGRAILAADSRTEAGEQYCSFDNGIYGHITGRNLAGLAAERGDLAEARGCGRPCSRNAPAIARRWRGFDESPRSQRPTPHGGERGYTCRRNLREFREIALSELDRPKESSPSFDIIVISRRADGTWGRKNPNAGAQTGRPTASAPPTQSISWQRLGSSGARGR